MSSAVDSLTGTPLAPMDTTYSALVATLVLLLAVSSAIVVRSLILRRRHQRLVEEAIRTGTWLPNNFDPQTGRRRRDIGQKPKLWEAWLHPNDDDGECEADEKRKWTDITPVCAAYVNKFTSSHQGGPAGSAEDPGRLPSRTPRLMLPFTRKRSSAPSPQPATVLSMASASSSSATATTTPTVRVAVLIAMPSASHRYTCDDSGPPVIEIGITEANVKDDESESLHRDNL